MRVLVTGTAGKIGAAVAREFLKQDYKVRGLDILPPAADLRGKIEVLYVDLTDRLALLKAAEDCDAIAHLAAIPNPMLGEEMLFAPNVLGTQYVLAAAEAQGIRRVALASSGCAFGYIFAKHAFDPQYLPVDEAHPSAPQDLYGLSKLLNEETARAYTRRSGMATTCLRLTTVFDLERAAQHGGRWLRWRMDNIEHRENDLWSYIDMQDTARAFRLAIENGPEGSSETLIIAARDSLTKHDIRDLVRRHFPQLAEGTADLAPDASLYDTRRAEEKIGFVAERPWRSFAELRALA